MQIRSELFTHSLCFDANLHCDAGISKSGDARASNSLVGVLHANHYAGHTCGDDRFGARWGATKVVARLECDVHRCTARCFAGSTQRLHFGMCLTNWLSETTEASTVYGYKHSAHPRVGPANVLRGGGNKHRLAHRLLVDVVHLFLLPSGL
jgi:hypothetical protein